MRRLGRQVEGKKHTHKRRERELQKESSGRGRRRRESSPKKGVSMFFFVSLHKKLGWLDNSPCGPCELDVLSALSFSAFGVGSFGPSTKSSTCCLLVKWPVEVWFLRICSLVCVSLLTVFLVLSSSFRPLFLVLLIQSMATNESWVSRTRSTNQSRGMDNNGGHAKLRHTCVSSSTERYRRRAYL